jgi:hypothetical protein
MPDRATGLSNGPNTALWAIFWDVAARKTQHAQWTGPTRGEERREVEGEAMRAAGGGDSRC